RPLSRNSDATPLKTLRVLASPCLILSKRARNTIAVTSLLPVVGWAESSRPTRGKPPPRVGLEDSAHPTTPTAAGLPQHFHPRRAEGASAEGPPVLIGAVTVAAAADGQVELARQPPQFLPPPRSGGGVLDLHRPESEGAQFPQTLPSAIIR